MNPHTHTVRYYETDKMAITHHSNYIRWMEEARMELLKSIGYGMKRLEAEGITSPVVSLECRYRRPTTFDDEIAVRVTVEKYSGVKLELSYVMTDTATGDVVFTARSGHCFIDEEGHPVVIKKRAPAFDELLRRELIIEKEALSVFRIDKPGPVR